MMFALLFVFALQVSAANPATARITVEESSPAVAGEGLIEAVGLETLGGVFTPLLPIGCAVPCSKTELFTTASDRQADLRITLVRGHAKMASGAHSLGTFVVSGWRPAPRGMPAIAITLAALVGASSCGQSTKTAASI